VLMAARLLMAGWAGAVLAITGGAALAIGLVPASPYLLAILAAAPVGLPAVAVVASAWRDGVPSN
jgi:uncharacterized membrane protein AbrB (regulator of aidB expression)